MVGRLGFPPCRWDFPDPGQADGSGLVCLGGDLEPATVVTAYASGIFPMPVSRRRLGWWSPDPRAVIPVDGLVVSRSLRRSMARYETRIDHDFARVIERCANIPRPHGWITPAIVDAYLDLHRLGIAHSIEAWDEDRLVGGLYGVSLGGLFAGESMYHEATDASKVALARLVEELAPVPGAVLDVQWSTPHLTSLGAIDVSRDQYRTLLGTALDAPTPGVFTGV